MLRTLFQRFYITKQRDKEMATFLHFSKGWCSSVQCFDSLNMTRLVDSGLWSFLKCEWWGPTLCRVDVNVVAWCWQVFEMASPNSRKCWTCRLDASFKLTTDSDEAWLRKLVNVRLVVYWHYKCRDPNPNFKSSLGLRWHPDYRSFKI